MMAKNDSQLVQEALVRYIRDAKRWTAVIEGWEALLNVQRMTMELKTERDHIAGDNSQLKKEG